MANFTLAALKIELTTDPGAIGYAALVAAGNVKALAALLNQQGRVGTNYRFFQAAVPSSLVVDAFDDTELSLLTTNQIGKLQLLLSPGIVNFSRPNTRTILTNIFPAAGPTRASLTTLALRQGSQAEKQWGAGMAVTAEQCADALFHDAQEVR